MLAAQLASYANRPDVLVLALGCGGVPVVFEVARWLEAPLDLFLVHCLSVPGHAELAMGAIASGGIVVREEAMVERFGFPDHLLAATPAGEQQELERQEHTFRGEGCRPMSATG